MAATTTLEPSRTHRSKVVLLDDGTWAAGCRVCEWFKLFDSQKAANQDATEHRRLWQKAERIERIRGLKTCDNCGTANLRWIRTGAGWRLADQMGNIHRCRGPG